jgi:hypothetical protein
MGLIKKLRKSKQEAKPNEKPDLVKTHLRDMIVVPEMIGSVIGIYSGKVCFGVCTMCRRLSNLACRSSTRSKLSRRWWATTWESSRSHSTCYLYRLNKTCINCFTASQSSTVDLVLVLLTLLVSFLSSKIMVYGCTAAGFMM